MTKGRCMCAPPLRHSLVLELHTCGFADGASREHPGQVLAVIGLGAQVAGRAGALSGCLCRGVDGIGTCCAHQRGFDR